MTVAAAGPRYDSTELAARVAEARRWAGLSQTALAHRIGVSLWSVERMERGELDPSPHLRAIAVTTGRSESFFRLPVLEQAAARSSDQPRDGTGRRSPPGARLVAAGTAVAWGRYAVMTALATLILVRFFSEKVHVLPKIATFIDVPLFVALLVLAAGLGKSATRRSHSFLLPAVLFFAIVVVSTLANIERVAAAPALIFVYGFLAPLAVYHAVYRLWPPGSAFRLSRFLVVLGVVQLAVVAIMDLPRFLATRNPDFVSGTFGDNAYQLVFFLLILTSLFAGIRMWEPHRLTARAAPVFFVAVAAVIFLAQYRALLVATLVSVLVIGAFLSVDRGSGVLLGAILLAVFVGSLSYVGAQFPTTKFDQTVSALQKDPWFFVDARIAPISSVTALYTDNPRYVVTGSGPATYSSRAWRTFADVRETRTAVAAPYATKVQGGAYRTDVSDKHILPLLQTAPAVQGSYSVNLPFSSYAALLAEVGVLGFVVLVGAYVTAIFLAARLTLRAIRRRKRNDPLPAVLLSATIAFTLLLQLAFLENWWEVTRITFLSWSLLAIGVKETDARLLEETT